MNRKKVRTGENRNFEEEGELCWQGDYSDVYRNNQLYHKNNGNDKFNHMSIIIKNNKNIIKTVVSND